MSEKKIEEDLDIEIYNEDQRFYADIKAQAEMAIAKIRADYKMLKAQIEFADAKIKELA